MSELVSARRRAALRLGLIAALVGAWCVHAEYVPDLSRIVPLKATVVKATVVRKITAKPAAASVSWLNEGAPLKDADLAILREEAEKRSAAKP